MSRFGFLRLLVLILIFNSQAFADNNLYQNLGLENISNNSDGSNNQPLSAAQAFILNIQPDFQDQLVNLNFKIAPGYYLYRSRLSFKLSDQPNIKNLEINYPEGVIREDPVFGNQMEYTGNLNLEIPLKNLISQNFITPSTDLLITYQGCSDQLCYPMQHQSFNLNQFAPKISPHEKPWFLVLSGLFILGLFLTFTPCVLPMIPILFNIILGKNLKNNFKNSLSLASAYVLGMALTYALVGFLISKIGVSFQAFFQTPWIIILMALLFVFLGFSTLGVFTLQLPMFIRHRVFLLDQKLKTGSLLGVFLMGVLSTLVISPCTSGPLIGVLSLMATSGNSFFGALSLFVLGLGMGVPLIIISVGLGKFIPKAGKWMQWVRVLMGCLMFVIAIYLLARLVPFNFVDNFLNNIESKPAPTAAYDLKVNSMAELDQVLNKNNNQKIILLDFYANWCVECQLLAQKLANPEFLKLVKNRVLIIRVDVSQDHSDSQELLDQYHVLGLPTLIKIDGNTQTRLVGNVSLKTLEEEL